jgi:hypothetical protein
MSKHALNELGIDPITFEVLRNGLDAIADEMAYTIVRSARSTMIKDCMDYSASLCTAGGDLIAGSEYPGDDVLYSRRAAAYDREVQGRFCARRLPDPLGSVRGRLAPPRHLHVHADFP